MTEQHTLCQMRDALRQSQHDLLAVLHGINDNGLYRPVVEGEWALAANLVHIAEAREFFISEVEKVLVSPGAMMGRTIADHARIENVREHDHDPRELIQRKLVTSYERLEHVLKQMSGDDAQTIGVHVKYGQQTLAEFIEHFIVEHDQAHVQQARGTQAP